MKICGSPFEVGISSNLVKFTLNDKSNTEEYTIYIHCDMNVKL